MAEYHLHASTRSRGVGKGAGGHVRYILRDGAYGWKRIGHLGGSSVARRRVSRADELLFSESAHMPSWVRDAKTYWDAADKYERANGTVYREIEFALPKELSDGENIALARAFAERLADVPGGKTPYTLAIHRGEKKPMLLHCHLMLSDKVNDGIDRDSSLWFRRAANKGLDPACGGAPKTQARIGQDWLGGVVRPLWSDLANAALSQAGVEARIDHRGLEERRMEQERMVEEARARGDEFSARCHARLAAELDRPAQPKKGRVLTHGGPEKAPGRAAMVVEYEAAKVRRVRAVAALREAEEAVERDRWAAERAERVRSAVRARQGQRDPFEKMGIRERWRKRQRARVERALDAETLAETRNGFRAPDPVAGDPARLAWAVYRERVLGEAYGEAVARDLGRWVRVERRRDGLRIHNRDMDLTDYGDRLVAGRGGNEREIEAMLKLAAAKGWKTLVVTGTEDFRLRAGAAALAAGFVLADGDLAARIRAKQERDAEVQRRRDLEAAPILAEWMRAYPKQAQAQRLAGGKLPWACPEGVDRAALRRTVLWEAAEAWMVGRYGDAAAWQALSKGPDLVKAQAADAGREAAYNAWAQDGLTLRVGKDAPLGRGTSWTLTGAVTRESVERYARAVRDRRERAGVAHGVTVTFGGGVSITKKVLVLEHLLRAGLPLEEATLRQAGEEAVLERARERLRTHGADGRMQAWYARKLERQEEARLRAEREEKLEALVRRLEQYGSAQEERWFREAGFAVNERGEYTYPDPDLPGVRKVWETLAAVRRKEREEDLRRGAEDLGYRVRREGWTRERRAADPGYQRILREIKKDPSLEKLVETAYQKGMARAEQEREGCLAQAREDLWEAAHGLGRRLEAAGTRIAKQVEIHQEFAKLVRRGSSLGMTEKELSQAVQEGRVAYRQEVARSRGPGMGW